MEEKLKTLHTNLIKEGYDLPAYDVFKTDMSDPIKSQKLHDNLVGEGYDLPDYNTFIGDMGLVKKKVSSQDIFTSASGKEELPFLGMSGKNPQPSSESVSTKSPSESPSTSETPVQKSEEFTGSEQPDILNKLGLSIETPKPTGFKEENIGTRGLEYLSGETRDFTEEERTRVQDKIKFTPSTAVVHPDNMVIGTTPKSLIEDYFKNKSITRDNPRADTVLESAMSVPKELASAVGGLLNDVFITPGNNIDKGFAQLFLGAEGADAYVKAKKAGAFTLPNTMSLRPAETLSKVLDESTKNLKSMPLGWSNDIAKGMIDILPDIAATLIFPEGKLFTLAPKLGLNLGKFGMEQAIRGYGQGIGESNGQLGLQLKMPVITALERGAMGWMYETSAGMSHRFARNLANKLMPNKVIGKAFLETGAATVGDGLTFGGLGSLDELLRTGQVTPDTFWGGFGMGVGFNVAGGAKLTMDGARVLAAKGLNTLLGMPSEGITRIAKSSLSVEELNKQADEKINNIENKTSTNPEGDAVMAFMLKKTAQVKAVADEVLSNKDELIKDIETGVEDKKVQEALIDKINEVDAANDPKVQDTKEITGQIDQIDNRLERIRKNKSWDDTRKEVESAPLKERKEELKQEAKEKGFGIKPKEKAEGAEEKPKAPQTELSKKFLKELEKSKKEETKIEEEKQEEVVSSVELQEGKEPTKLSPTDVNVEKVLIDKPTIVKNTATEIDRVKNTPLEEETGATFNLDGTKYDKGGLVVPITSENITQGTLKAEDIADFVERNKEKIGSDSVKPGISKFPNETVSLDLNIVSNKENKDLVLEFARRAGQESVFDLDTFENIKTGADGKNPMKFTNEQFKEIAKSLSEGKMPEAVKDIPPLEKVPEIVSKKGKLATQEKSEVEVPPKEESVEKPSPVTEKQGITYKDKTYQSVDEISEDYDKFPSQHEYNKVLEEVRKFEDGLRTEAVKKSEGLGKKLKLSADKSEEKIKSNVERLMGDLKVKFFPLSLSEANTALWKRLVPVKDAAVNWIAKKLTEGTQNQTRALRVISKIITGYAGGAGRTTTEMFGKKGVVGIGKLEMMGTSKEFAPWQAKKIQEELSKIVNSDPESLARVHSVLDPELGTIYEVGTKQKIAYSDLTPPEQALYDQLRDMNEWVHETNFINGFIPTKAYIENKDKYLARMYDVYETPSEIDNFIKRHNNAINTDIYKMREEVDNWKSEHAITDPVYLTSKRVMQTIQNQAIKEYMDLIEITQPNLVKTIAKGDPVPKGFTKLSDSYSWGPLRGKAVANHIVEDFRGFFYANHLLNTTYDVMKMFDRNKINQFYKKFRTVYNPFVQLGNMTGNLFFGSIAGINPGRLIVEQANAIRDAKAGTDEYKKVLRSGILGATGITGDMAPITSLTPQVKAAQGILAKAVRLFGKVDKAATELYQGADNVAKYAAYKVFKSQGLTHEQAIRRTYDSFQNYATVGKTWDVASKIPLVGNKFIKFQADLQRILLNGVTTSPLSTIGTLMLISAVGTLASRLSGETDEEKEERETRKGVAKIPLPFGMSIPLSFKVGKKEVNVARYLSPLYLYRNTDAETDIAELSKFMPIQVQKRKDNSLFPKVVYGDPALGWIASIWQDADFRNMSIQNPKGTYYQDPNIIPEERIANIVHYAMRSQVPFFKSGEDIYDGITGNLDYYGRKRTWSDAILNMIIKVQEFDKPELKAYVEGNINYLTSRYATLAKKMGDSNSLFKKEMDDEEKKGITGEALDRVYKIKDKRRAAQIKLSEKQMIPITQELDRLTSVYKKWYPSDPESLQFMDQNFMNIEAGKNQMFNVLDDIDIQKKYKPEYKLLKDNGMLKKPDMPNYWEGKPLTPEQKKEYSSTYWSSYLRYLDMYVGLSQEEFDSYNEIITSEKTSTKRPKPDQYSLLQELAANAAKEAKKEADIELGLY